MSGGFVWKISFWLDEVRDVVANDLVVMVVGNKVDLKAKQAIETAPAEEFDYIRCCD